MVRPDRIGDVVLSTPALQLLKAAIPDAEVHVLVNKNVAPVLAQLPFVSRIISPPSSGSAMDRLRKLSQMLGAERYDLAIVLQVEPLSTLAVRLARIPNRVGPRSKFYSYMAFNYGLKQRRSDSKQNEADYNTELVRHAIRVLGRDPLEKKEFQSKIVADPSLENGVIRDLSKLGLEPGRFVLLHPGMGGSALNWSIDSYAELIRLIISRGRKVLVSGSSVDEDTVQKIVMRTREIGVEQAHLNVLLTYDLPHYIALLKLAGPIVAPSTGPLHLAAGLGKPCVSFYPPIQVQSSKRWGPRSRAAQKIFTPEVACGQKYNCIGSRCEFYYCMDRISPETVAKEVEKLAENASVEIQTC